MAKKVSNYISSTKWIFLLILFAFQDLPHISGFTHWVVTEEGKIEAQVSLKKLKYMFYINQSNSRTKSEISSYISSIKFIDNM